MATNWQKVGSIRGLTPTPVTGFPKGFAQPGQLFTPSIGLADTSRKSHYRVELTGGDVSWRVGEVCFLRGNQRVEAGGPYNFSGAWMSAGSGEEWVYVDLGSSCEFDRVVLFWIARASEGLLQVSDDAAEWRDLQALPDSTGPTDDIKLTQSGHGSYVRVLMRRPSSPYGYILSEMEIYGRGGFVAKAKAAPLAKPTAVLTCRR